MKYSRHQVYPQSSTGASRQFIYDPLGQHSSSLVKSNKLKSSSLGAAHARGSHIKTKASPPPQFIKSLTTLNYAGPVAKEHTFGNEGNLNDILNEVTAIE